jgi:predicted ATP-binding protein involved in virulence
MFPKVQFIVSTHSPFVITSLRDAVVYDLEKHERLENPGIYSYEAVVEAYLDTGQYSEEMKQTFKRYRELCGKTRSEDEEFELQQLLTILEMVPPASKELYLAFRLSEDKREK